jgi:hypothetical protein
VSVIRPQFRQPGQGYLAVAEYLVPVYGAKGETILPGDHFGALPGFSETGVMVASPPRARVVQGSIPWFPTLYLIKGGDHHTRRRTRTPLYRPSRHTAYFGYAG